MAFDPDAYLRSPPPPKAGGFDPDAYLAQTNPRREALEAKSKRAKAEIAQLQADPQNRLTDYASAGASALGEHVKAMGQGALALGKTFLDPGSIIRDGSKRRELGRGVDDAVTLGYGRQYLYDPVVSRLGGTPLAATEEADAAAAPGYRTGGNIVGAAFPWGAEGMIAKTAGRAMAKAIPEVGGLVSKLGRPAVTAARGAATAATAAPVIAASHASSEGDRLGAATNALTDPAALALGAGAGAIAGTAGVKARQFIESRGGKVNPLSPGHGGAFAKELKGLPANDKGIGEAARIGAEKTMAGLKEQNAVETSRPYKKMKELIDKSPEASATRDIAPLMDTLQEAVYDLETAPHARTQLEGTLKVLERYRAQGPKNEFGEPAGPVMVPERQLNGLRRSLMRAAKVGATDAPGEAEAPLRAAAFAVKDMVDEGPYAALNEFYAKGATKNTGARRQLGLKPKPSKDENVDTKKLKLGLEREVQNTKTAGGDSDLEAFRRDNPKLARASEFAKLANARADLSFRLMPQHGGLLERGSGAAVLGGGVAAMAGGPAGLAAGAGALALQNWDPLMGRIAHPLAQRATNPMILASQAERERQRRKAETLRRGRAR